MPRAMRPCPPSFSLANTKIVSPSAMCLPPYIVFCAMNASVFARGSRTSALIANVMRFSTNAPAFRGGDAGHPVAFSVPGMMANGNMTTTNERMIATTIGPRMGGSALNSGPDVSQVSGHFRRPDRPCRSNRPAGRAARRGASS